MSILDKVVAAITPEESDAERAEARARAAEAAESGDWLSLILKHHRALEIAFAEVKSAVNETEQVAAQKRLAVLLTGHAIAEEAVLYPALAKADEEDEADTGYSEQATVKMQMADLEGLTPMTRDYFDKLEHIRKAVAHHMYEEEGDWFLDLKETVPASDQERITKRYEEEFTRYVGRDDGAGSGARTLV